MNASTGAQVICGAGIVVAGSSLHIIVRKGNLLEAEDLRVGSWVKIKMLCTFLEQVGLTRVRPGREAHGTNKTTEGSWVKIRMLCIYQPGAGCLQGPGCSKSLVCGYVAGGG